MASLIVGDAAIAPPHPVEIDGLVLEIREPLAPVARPSTTVNLRWIGDEPGQQPSWLIKKILPETGVALLSGQFSAGKTFVEIDLALSVGLALPFLGRRVKQGGVFWIAAEGSGEIGPRVEAARRGKFDPALGERHRIPFVWSDEAPPLNNSDGFRWLDDACRKAKSDMREKFNLPLRLVPIDTLAAAFGLEDEKDNAAAAALMKRLADFGKKHELLVMPIAHLGKNAEAGTRGASAFGAGADAVLSVLANGDSMKGTVSSRSLVLSKSRGGATGPLGFFELHEVDLGKDEDGDPVTSCCVRFVERTVEAGPKTQPVGKGERQFLEALDEAISAVGKSHKPMADGPLVKAANLLSVRAEFDRRYVSGEQGDKQTSATRTAWKRSLDALHSKRIIATERTPLAELVWRL